jgi:integrase
MRLRQKLITLPPGVDIVDFVAHDGKPPERAESAVPGARTTLLTLRDRYFETMSNGSMESNTLGVARIYFKHVIGTLGPSFALDELKLGDLQRHVDARCKKGVKPVTVGKELATFRAAWNWGVLMGLTGGRFPNKGLRYPRGEEKPPFMTCEEIERQVAAGGLTPKQKRTLWDALYLQKHEMDEALEIVRERAAHGWIYPMAATAAFTGARRSELTRMRVSDVDFERKVVTVRKKKRVHGKQATRRVPLSNRLASILTAYLKDHAGGSHLFCHARTVERSKNRSRTTGHHSGPDRATSLKGRLATVREREAPALRPLTESETRDHLKRSLARSKWSVIRGWHVWRHGFIGVCASSGVDQRFIDEWAGHQTDEQRRRYRHLAPDAQHRAMESAFD